MIGIRYRQLQRALAAWRRSARDLDLEVCLEALRRILADFSELLLLRDHLRHGAG
jgi:hypothetical protein